MVFSFCIDCGQKLERDCHYCPRCGAHLEFKVSKGITVIRKSDLTPEIEKEVDAKVVALIGEGGYMGYCHAFWSRKKAILREEYGIEWKTPAELNPHITFD